MRSKRIRLYHFGVIIFVLGFSTATNGQTPPASPTPAPRTPTLESQFFKNVLHDQKAIWTSPFHLQKKDARWLAPMGLATAALIATDRTTAGEIAEFDDQLQASRIVSYAGSTYGAAGVGAAFYLIGRTRHNQRARETGLLSWEALIDSELVVLPLKAIAERRRPLALNHRGNFFKIGTSFPSGHAIHAWSVATVIANEYSDHPAAQVAAYGIAAAVSMARFTGEKHFLSDILVGSAMGYGIGRYVYRAHHIKRAASRSDEEETLNRARRWPAIAPEFDRRKHSYGVMVAWNF